MKRSCAVLAVTLLLSVHAVIHPAPQGDMKAVSIDTLATASAAQTETASAATELRVGADGASGQSSLPPMPVNISEQDASIFARTAYNMMEGLLLPVPCRENLPETFASKGLNGYAAEVGVLRGGFSRQILDHWPGTKLFLIDPWIHQESDYVDVSNSDQAGMDANLQQTILNVAPHKGRYQIIRAFSEEAAAAFDDGFLDWVYIDADHRYEAVKADIDAWWPKIKAGGVLAGHDWVFDGYYPTAGKFGVMRAVTEFAAKANKQVVVTFGEPAGPSQPGSVYCSTRVPSWYLMK